MSLYSGIAFAGQPNSASVEASASPAPSSSTADQPTTSNESAEQDKSKGSYTNTS